MTHRFFRSDESTYEAVRSALDQAWGLAENGTTCIEPADSAPRDSSGMILLGVHATFCEWLPANDLLASCISQGSAVEISMLQYFDALPAP